MILNGFVSSIVRSVYFFRSPPTSFGQGVLNERCLGGKVLVGDLPILFLTTAPGIREETKVSSARRRGSIPLRTACRVHCDVNKTDGYTCNKQLQPHQTPHLLSRTSYKLKSILRATPLPEKTREIRLSIPKKPDMTQTREQFIKKKNDAKP